MSEIDHTDHGSRAAAASADSGRASGPQVPGDDQALARLLRLAGPRPQVAEQRAARVRAAVYAHWQGSLPEQVESSRSNLTVWALAAAAAIVIATTVALLSQTGANKLTAVATVEAITGRVLSEENNAELLVGSTVTAGSGVVTPADGRAALRLAAGQSLRLDTGTRLRLLSLTAVELSSGAVYLDTGADHGPLEIRTSIGTARDLGTQFEVRVTEGELRIRVREGTVLLDRDGRSHEAKAGTELTVAADGTLVCSAVKPYGREWDWVLEIAPTFELEGASLAAFLDWVSRETGWTIRAADEETADAFSSVFLHGSIVGLTPDQAPAAVLPTCDLDYNLDDGVLTVGPTLGGQRDE